MEIIILQSYKNLGTVLMGREEYITAILTQHLCDDKTYTQLSPMDSMIKINEFRHNLNEILEYYGEKVME